MKKILCIFLIIATLLPIVGCGQVDGPPEKEDWVQPPTRFGTDGIAHPSFAKNYATFGAAFGEAKVVARVVVGDWIGDDGFLTYYKATVRECYKGEIPESIILFQDGFAEFTYQDYPLFTGGNEMLVFLNDAKSKDYDHGYWIIGSFMTFMDVGYDSDGNRYFADRFGNLGVTVSGCKNYSSDKSVEDAVCKYIFENDPALAEYQYAYIFSEEDMDKYFDGLNKYYEKQ